MSEVQDQEEGLSEGEPEILSDQSLGVDAK